MTRLVDPPLEVTIELDAEGKPTRLTSPITAELEALAHWRVEVDWWRQPVEREYWRVLVDGNFICEVFREVLREVLREVSPDAETRIWFLDRVYD